MSHPTPDQFRKKLIEQLAYATRWPRQVALHGGEEGIAAKLGVQEDVFDEAVTLSRIGFRVPDEENRVKPGPKPSGLVKLHLHYPIEILSLVGNLALEMDRERTNLIRDLLHAAMMTNSEPTKRPRRRHRKVVLRGKLLSGKFSEENVRISPALLDAIRRRAIAYGETAHAYVRCWLVDLVEGELGHIDISSVRLGQMFDSEEAYVLPLLTAAP